MLAVVRIIQDALRHEVLAFLVGAVLRQELVVPCPRVTHIAVEQQGLFCALYSDRASHFFWTPKAGEAVDRERLTQVGRALAQLGIEMIPAYSPQARGRSERSFQTWQGRLPQELRLHGITSVEEANRFLRERYIVAFNRRFAVPAAQAGSAFVSARGRPLEEIFSLHHERVVAQDNTVRWGNRCLQIEKTRWRATLAGCRVTVFEHLDGTLTLGYGPHRLGPYDPERDDAAVLLPRPPRPAGPVENPVDSPERKKEAKKERKPGLVEKWKSEKAGFPLSHRPHHPPSQPEKLTI